MTEEQLLLVEIAKTLLNGLLILAFTKTLIEYVWEHRKELRDNWYK